MLYSYILVTIFRINSEYNRKKIIFCNQTFSFLNSLKKNFQSRFSKSLSTNSFKFFEQLHYDSSTLSFELITIFK
ncbi:hypothetical protein AR546_05610 [Leptospira interrogans serovar Canicola]|uniref:Uncharacterized protein n=1 Tax=Leptospira interrogans serovar Canicola TaxID=211880 RepID=A0A067YD04_LEPIR|nr:hypothetical protein [Leptospira interrogans serovar Canicola]OLZ32370.1 hypothetical protein AR546_05610 [Leptospira interrogans serovar Canicola]OOB98973.1 hypothetical protein B0192_08575 [Leptospira interrogans serovar Australis]POR17609.1 hypothetical protein B0T34_14345 [Leptospira interrogans serovar Canicola]